MKRSQQTVRGIVQDIFEQLPAMVNGNANLRRLGQNCSLAFMLECDGISHHFRIDRGEIVEMATGTFRMRPWSFAIRAPETAWREFWQLHPKPGYQDIFALARFGHASVDGDMWPLLDHLRFIKEVLAAPRPLTPEAAQ